MKIKPFITKSIKLFDFSESVDTNDGSELDKIEFIKGKDKRINNTPYKNGILNSFATLSIDDLCFLNISLTVCISL